MEKVKEDEFKRGVAIGFQGKASVLMSIREAADYLNLKVSKVRAMVFRNEIPYMKIGRLVRFHRHDIDAWISSFRRKAYGSSDSGRDSYKLPIFERHTLQQGHFERN